MSSPARPPCTDDDGLEVSDRQLLLAYSAAEAASLSMALNCLADDNTFTRTEAWKAQQLADHASFAFCLDVGHGSDLDPDDRIVEVRNFLTEHVTELEAMRERLML